MDNIDVASTDCINTDKASIFPTYRGYYEFRVELDYIDAMRMAQILKKICAVTFYQPKFKLKSTNAIVRINCNQSDSTSVTYATMECAQRLRRIKLFVFGITDMFLFLENLDLIAFSFYI